MATKENQINTSKTVPVHSHQGSAGSQNAQPELLAQFTAATGTGYQPKSQAYTAIVPMVSNTASSNKSNQNQSVTATKSSNNTWKNFSTGFQPPPPQQIDLKTTKGFKFAVIDPYITEVRPVYDAISNTFKWEMCNTEEQCMNFIRTECANKRAFLVSSGGLGKSIIPKIHDLPQLYAVYIHCADVVFHQTWASQFSKVRIVCNDDDKHLLPQFAVDVAQANIDWGDALLQAGNSTKAKEKFELALKNLTTYEKVCDPTMIVDVKRKLTECK